MSDSAKRVSLWTFLVVILSVSAVGAGWFSAEMAFAESPPVGAQSLGTPVDLVAVGAVAGPTRSLAPPLPTPAAATRQPAPPAGSLRLDPGDGPAPLPRSDNPPGSDDSPRPQDPPEPLPDPPPATDGDATALAGSASVLDKHVIVGYYGNPNSTRMGILGEYAVDNIAQRLAERAAEYQPFVVDRTVIGAFHLIYATVWEDANVGYLRDELVRQYVDYAERHGLLVILDHQLGRFTVEESVTRMLPWLHSSVVHLAIDPEWSTLIPGREIGSVTAESINRAQELMRDYLVEQQIPGDRMLIVHQFNWRMIQNRPAVRADIERVDLVHNADGFGTPNEKIATWQYLVQADNMPVKGFKLFYQKPWRGWGSDIPLMTPEQVMNLVPQPVYINYQ